MRFVLRNPATTAPPLLHRVRNPLCPKPTKNTSTAQSKICDSVSTRRTHADKIPRAFSNESIADAVAPFISAGYMGFFLYFSLNWNMYRQMSKRIEQDDDTRDENDVK